MLDAGLSLPPLLLQIQADAGVRAMHATARPSIQITSHPPPHSCFRDKYIFKLEKYIF